MTLKGSAASEFSSWDGYRRFSEGVRHGSRYVWNQETKSFLDAVLATNKGRNFKLPKGTILFRAQRGIDWRPIHDEEGNELGDEPIGYDSGRMKPRPNRAIEGRANPAGISVLYLATTEKTAISEVRPWVGAWVSVAQFKTNRALKALDLSRGHGQFSIARLTLHQLMHEEEIDAKTRARAVWTDIDAAFSRPVYVTDDAADYVPTQILAEVFRNAGYDAIIYRSLFGERGYNLALFDVEDADPVNCAPYEVTGIEVEAKENGSRWFAPSAGKPRRASKSRKAGRRDEP